MTKSKGPGGGRPGGPEDPWADPDAQRWLKRAKSEMVPQLEASGAAVALVPDGGLDMKFCVELGAMIMLDKPIIIAVPPGRKVPSKLVLVADEIVELDLDDPTVHERMADAIERVSSKGADDDT